MNPSSISPPSNGGTTLSSTSRIGATHNLAHSHRNRSNSQRIGFHSSTEVYGFVLWMATFVLYLAFLLWAFIPEQWMWKIGITYYPSKHWALTLPSYVCVTLAVGVISYIGYNMFNTTPLDSINTITDCYARPQCEEDKLTSIFDNFYSIPEISDIPITTINKLMYE